MAGFYDNMAATATRLLRKYKRGNVVLVRKTLSPGENEWDDPVLTEETETLDAVVTGISAQMIGTPVTAGGPVFLASDRQVLCATPVEYGANDVIRIDGKAVTVLRVDNILAAGDPLAVKLFVRS